LKRRYGDQVDFLAIYVREAHPTDGWRMSSNDAAGISIKQPRVQREREDVAKTCCSSLKMSMPLLVDEMDDRVGHAYSGMPDRLYLIDRKGRVAYKSGRGPFGFKPGELEQSLILLMLDEGSDAAKSAVKGSNGPATVTVRKQAQTTRSMTVPTLTDEEAWNKMKPYVADKVSNQHLPMWIRALAVSLPKTAAAMLELDHAQRVESTLPPQLRAKLRWIAADANRCEYAKAHARFDYVQAGGKSEDIDGLSQQIDKLPEAERLALLLARQLVREAYSVGDEHVARLVELYGEKQVVAIVLVTAYANFQDRLLLALGATVEESGPLPPLRVRLRPPPERTNANGSKEKPKRVVSAPATNPPRLPEKLDDPEWSALSFDALRARLNGQIARRKARVPIPDWETVHAQLPADMPQRDKPIRIQWSLLTYGYQPRLTAAWLGGLRAFREESDLEMVFYESMFWVVTRSLQCFY
jgi:alkylhydroperoxidase family enzyme